MVPRMHEHEHEAPQALAARQYLDRVYHGTAEEVAHLIPDGAYDAIVFSDARPDGVPRKTAEGRKRATSLS